MRRGKSPVVSKGKIEQVYSFFEGEEKKASEVKRKHGIKANPQTAETRTLWTARKVKADALRDEGRGVEHTDRCPYRKRRIKKAATAMCHSWSGAKGKHVVMAIAEIEELPRLESDAVHGSKRIRRVLASRLSRDEAT